MDTSALQLFEQLPRNFKNKYIDDYKSIISVQFSKETGEGNLLLSSGKKIQSICLRCEHPSCMRFSKEELKLLIDFPADTDNIVCPSLAITWSNSAITPEIDPNLCISCGLCISRCPIGAIYFDEQFIATINTGENEDYTEDSSTNSKFDSMLMHLKTLPKDNILKCINDDHLTNVYSKINHISSSLSLQFPNLIIRNILLSLGLYSVIRRRGDIYIRMDMLFSDESELIGTAEIEAGNDILNSPRNILDNIAILHTRYKFEKEKILPLIISFSLPNQRSEYWQVISDIQKITNIKISSITLGALLMILWQGKKITMNDIKLFYTDNNTYSIRNAIEHIIMKESFELPIGHLGILESTK